MFIQLKFKKFLDLLNKVRVFYKPESANYWHTITPCNITQKPSEIERYYLDFRSKVDYVQSFDINGVPLFEYLNEIPRTYHPIAISQYALGLYDVYCENNFENDEIRNRFLTQANWLCNNASINGNGAIWYFNYPDFRYGIKPKWCSAMAQGEAISVLCRAHRITGNDFYIKTAELALLPFFINVKDGGVRNNYKGTVLFEEFPTSEVTGVLNGFIFALFGLNDLFLTSNNERAATLFNEGICSLKNLLKYYDLGYWSRYDLFKFPLANPASYTYHELHIEQLKALYILTKEKIFSEYSEKWKQYDKGMSKKTRALLNKIIYLRKVNKFQHK